MLKSSFILYRKFAQLSLSLIYTEQFRRSLNFNNHPNLRNNYQTLCPNHNGHIRKSMAFNNWMFHSFGCSQIFAHWSHLEGSICSLKVALLIAILLITGGVERNSGLPKRDVRLLVTSSPVRDESPLAEYQSEKFDRILLNLEALANDNKRMKSKFDAFVLTMNTRFNGLKTEIDTHEIKIDKLSKDLECNSLLVKNSFY